jgi:hypothetical protein
MDILIGRAKRIAHDPNTLDNPDNTSPFVTLAQLGGMLAGSTLLAQVVKNPKRIADFVRVHVLNHEPHQTEEQKINDNSKEWDHLLEKITQINADILAKASPANKVQITNILGQSSLQKDPLVTSKILIKEVCQNSGGLILKKLEAKINNYDAKKLLYLGINREERDSAKTLLDFLDFNKIITIVLTHRLKNVTTQLENIPLPDWVKNIRTHSLLHICSDRDVSKVLLWIDAQLV